MKDLLPILEKGAQTGKPFLLIDDAGGGKPPLSR
jgi:hypothetical protein